MAGSSDKARLFLEQSIPELKEYEHKKIFSAEEINKIAKKRSKFEHKVNAPGTQPADYARYAEFEINMETLRRRRINRLRIKSVARGGQRRVFFILERATRRFPGNIGLLMQQIEHARQQKAYKKLSQILTRALRLHPSKPDLWIYSAHLAMDEHADITEARSFMQRGIRFCKSSKVLWLEYMRIELRYLAKLTARREILGLQEIAEVKKPEASLNDGPHGAIDRALPAFETTSTNVGHAAKGDEAPLQQVYRSPALTGGIPIAIFDAAMSQFEDDEKLAQEFFDTVQCASLIPLHGILRHIVNHMQELNPRSWRTLLCRIKFFCAEISVSSPDFPQALGQSLKALQEACAEARTSKDFVKAIQAWLKDFLDRDELDVALREIMISTLKKLQREACVPVQSI